MLNKVMMIGHLTKDIELRYLQNGTAIATSGIAVTKKFKNEAGQEKETVLFIDFTIFGRRAEIANQFMKKGDRIYIEGELKLDSWIDGNNQKRSKHSISVSNFVFLKCDKNQPQQPHRQQHQQQPQQQRQPQGYIPEVDIDDDEIPF